MGNFFFLSFYYILWMYIDITLICSNIWKRKRGKTHVEGFSLIPADIQKDLFPLRISWNHDLKILHCNIGKNNAVKLVKIKYTWVFFMKSNYSIGLLTYSVQIKF